MPNIKEVLKEFVATANAGQYKTEGELLSRFPELNGYDINTLKEFVATANAGQYASEDDLLSRFPEFNQPVKKKETTVSLSQQESQPISSGINQKGVSSSLATPDFRQTLGSAFKKSEQEKLQQTEQVKPSTKEIGKQQALGALEDKENLQFQAESGLESVEEGKPFSSTSLIEQFESKKTPDSYLYGIWSNIPTSTLAIVSQIPEAVKFINDAVEAGIAQVKLDDLEKTMANRDFSDIDVAEVARANRVLERVTPKEERPFWQDLISSIISSSISMTASAPSKIKEGLIGAGAGSVIPGAGTISGFFGGVAGGTSLGLEYSGTFNQSLKNNGYDVTNEYDLINALSDKKVVEDARNLALSRGIPVATFDMLTGTIAGKTYKAVSKSLAKSTMSEAKKKAIAASAELVSESLLGGTGELSGQLSAGEEISGRDIALEALSEVTVGAPSLAYQYMKSKSKTPSQAKFVDIAEKDPYVDVKDFSAKITNPEIAKIKDQIDELNKIKDESVSDITKNEADKKINELKEEYYKVKNETIESYGPINEAKGEELLSIKKEIEQTIEDRNNATNEKEKQFLDEVLLKLKEKFTNAIQEQTTSEIPIQPEARVGEEVAQGEPQAEPQVTAEEAVKEEVVTPSEEAPATEEELTAALERISLPEEAKAEVAAEPATAVPTTEKALPSIDDELKKINESIGRVKEEVDADKDEQTLQELGEKVTRAKNKIAKADDTDAAIEEFKQAQKEKTDFEEAVQKKKEFNKVDALISDEVYEKNKGNYEYQELFDQDPRLAAIQSAKDLIKYYKEQTDDYDYERSIASSENDIRMLEEDIAKFPVKEVAAPKAEVAKPKVSLTTRKAKAPKAKSTPAPTPAPSPAPVAEPVIETITEEQIANEELKKLGQRKVKQGKGSWRKSFNESKDPFKKAAILRAIAQVSTDVNEQADILEAAIGMPEESNIIEELKRKQPAPAPAPAPVPAPVPVAEPIVEARTVEQLREEYKLKIQKVNLDNTLSDKQKSEKVKELKKEFAEKKDKMVAPQPKAKVAAGTTAPSTKVQEEEVSYDDVKDLDVSNPTFLEIVEGFLEDADDTLADFGRGNLSSGMAIPLARAIIKSLKVLVKAGIKLQDAIARVAAENNIEPKEVVQMIKDIDKAQTAMAKFKQDIKNEVQAAKEGARSVSDAIKAITYYFNSNANRGNLTRKDLVRVINIIAKVKDQKSLDKAADKMFEIIDKAKTDVIEVSEYKSLLSQIKLEAKAALGAKKDINQKRKDLSAVIKAMETSGKLTAAKAKSLLNRIGKVNLDNPASVDAFLDYVEKVFEDANYEVELAGIKSKLARMKSNINKVKVGNDEVLIPLLNKLVSIDPSLIPDEVFDSYKELVDMLGDSAAVLDITKNVSEITAQTQEILDQVEDQLSVIPDLTTRLFDYDRAVLTDEGKLDYAATLKNMVEDNVIDEDEKALMQKYKSYIMPKTMKVPKSPAELAEERKGLIEEIKKTNTSIANSLKSKLQKLDANELVRISKTKAIEALTNKELQDLLAIFQNIENGIYTSYANKLLVKMRSRREADILSAALSKVKIPKVIEMKAKIMDRRKALYNRMEKGFLYYIDELVDNFKTKDIYYSIFEPLAKAAEPYKLEMDKINKKLQDAKNALDNSLGGGRFKRNPNAVVESMMKMAIYRIQREYNENPNLHESGIVKPAWSYIKATVDAKNTKYGERDKEKLMSIADKFGVKNDKGEIIGIDAEKLYDSFSKVEKSVLETFDEINKSLQDLGVFVTDIVRGNKIYLHNAYNHINVLQSDLKEADPVLEFQNRFSGVNMVSTKGKSLMGRTGGDKASPIDFNIFSTVQRGANFVLMDYYLTNPVRQARQTISMTRDIMKKDSKTYKEKEDLLDMVEEASEVALKSMLSRSLVRDTKADKALKAIAQSGVASILADSDKLIKEYISNAAYVFSLGRKDWAEGFKIMRKVKPEDIVMLAEASKGTTINRTFGANPLGLKMIDTDLLYRQTGIGEDKLKGGFANVMSQLYNYSLRPTKNLATTIATTMTTSGDKMMMQPLWTGAYYRAFEAITGEKIDLEKVKEGDVDYLIKNQGAMEAAAQQADSKIAAAGTVDNPFMKSLRSYTPEDRSAFIKFYRMYNNFMTNFQINEFFTIRRGVHAAVGNGMISKEQGAWLTTAAMSRMLTYTLIGNLGSGFILGLFTDEEDDDDDKTFMDKLIQSLATTFTTILMGAEGNIARSAFSYGIEEANESIIGEDEYDPYEDKIQFTFLKPGKNKKVDALDVVAAVAGPYSPAINTLDLAMKKMYEEPKKEADAIERAEKELYVRLPIEIVGNAGYLPFYKDIKKAVNKSIYKELDRELDKQGQKEEEFKPMGLNRSDLKRYYPEVYEQYYGEGTEADAKRKLEKEKRILEQRMKDEYYNYVPKKRERSSRKKRGEFGSAPFGESR